MRTIAAVGLAVVGLVAMTANANAVPSFVRSTGLTCNQCHISHTPVPSFTFTGKKFRMNGYRMPMVGEKIEAGEEGKLNGRRLSIPLVPMLSFRFGSSILSQAKAPGAASAAPVATRPQSNQAMFFVGPIGDYFGLWMETYFINGSNRGNSLSSVSAEEFDLKFVKITDKNTFGLSLGNEGVRNITGFGPWPIQLTDYSNYGTSGSWHPGLAAIYAYGMFNDRVMTVFGASPGADNPLWDRYSWQGFLGVALMNHDDNELWLDVNGTIGNDAIPISTAFSAGTANNVTYSDAIQGISATRGGSKAPASYMAADLGDVVRLNFEAQYSFIDRGPHSAMTQLRYTTNRDTYADRAEMTDNAVGLGAQYFYNRTYGLNVFVNKHLKYDFMDANGVTHKVVPNDISWSTYLTYRMAMNLAVNLQVGNSKRLVLENIVPSVSNGWSWNLGMDILF